MPTKVVTLTFPVAYLISHRNSHLDHNPSHNLTIYSTNASRESSQGGSKYKVYFDAWMYIVIRGSCFKCYNLFLFNELLLVIVVRFKISLTSSKYPPNFKELKHLKRQTTKRKSMLIINKIIQCIAYANIIIIIFIFKINSWCEQALKG